MKKINETDYNLEQKECYIAWTYTVENHTQWSMGYMVLPLWPLAMDRMVYKSNMDTHTTWRFLGFEIEVTSLYSNQWTILNAPVV